LKISETVVDGPVSAHRLYHDHKLSYTTEV